MAKEVVSIEVEKSGYEVMQAVVELLKAVKSQHAAGGGLVVEITADITSAIGKLGPVMGVISQLPADALEDRKAMLKGILVSAADLVEAVLA